VEAARFGSERCARLRKLARLPARPWRRALAGGFNFGSKLLAAMLLWSDDRIFLAWSGKVVNNSLTCEVYPTGMREFYIPSKK